MARGLGCRLRRAVLEPVFIRVDDGGFGVDEIQSQSFRIQYSVLELGKVFEDFSAEDDIEADGGKEELDIVRVGYDEDVTAGFLDFLHVEDQGADSTATEKGGFIEIEDDVGAALLHHFVDLGV